jgi:hypothetical protein
VGRSGHTRRTPQDDEIPLFKAPCDSPLCITDTTHDVFMPFLPVFRHHSPHLHKFMRTKGLSALTRVTVGDGRDGDERAGRESRAGARKRELAFRKEREASAGIKDKGDGQGCGG